MYEIKICDMSHLQQAVEITKLKNKNGGVEANWVADYTYIFKKYLSKNPDHMMLGAFDGDKLISFVCLAFFRDHDPAWFIVFMFTTKFYPVFSFNRPEIGLLIKTAFEVAEQRNYCQYYYSIAKKHEELYDRLWEKNQYVETGKYITTTELVVPPYTPVDRDRYWRLVGQRVHDVEVVIKRRILRPEKRIRYHHTHELELSSHKIFHNSPQLWKKTTVS